MILGSNFAIAQITSASFGVEEAVADTVAKKLG
jgi:hypothetical protein